MLIPDVKEIWQNGDMSVVVWKDWKVVSLVTNMLNGDTVPMEYTAKFQKNGKNK